MEKKKIWLSLAHMSGNEEAFIKEAFDTNWVVPLGPNVNGFEEDLKAYLSAPQPPKGGVLGSADPAYYGELKKRAEHHRNNPTEAESVMWNLLSGHQLEGYKFRRQHIIGQYIADFVCLEKMLIVEIDGEYHNDPIQKKDDKIREEWLSEQGYRVIRLSNKEVLSNPDNVLNSISADLNSPFRGLGGSGLSVVALSAGTAALHLALVIEEVGPGDEVLCQSFTFSATANPIKYQGANPVFVGSEKDTWNMDPVALREAIEDRIRKTGKKPKAIMPVHLYGMPAKMDEIMAISKEYEIPVVEDAAEAMGSEYNGQKCGTFGDYGVLSFNGNKMITTSGGGALICPSEEKAKRVMFYATQARDNAPHYQHSKIGYNYRLSNISAGIGRGQMTVVNEHIAARRRNCAQYVSELSDLDGVTVKQNPSPSFDSNFWLSCVVIDPQKAGFTREDLRLKLEAEEIESRPLWKPMHLQPVFEGCPYYGDRTEEKLFDDGLCLPSGPLVTPDDITRISSIIRSLHK